MTAGRRGPISLLYHRLNHRWCDGDDGSLEITQRRWSREWRRRWWRGCRRWRSAARGLSHPHRRASRGPSTSRTSGQAGTFSVGSARVQFSAVGEVVALSAVVLLGSSGETSHVVSPARQAPPRSCSRRNATSFATLSSAAAQSWML